MKKKNLVFAVSALLGVALFTSCKKTDNHTPTEQAPLKKRNATADYNTEFSTPNDITVKCVDGVLEFASIADYEQALTGVSYEALKEFLSSVKATDFYAYTEQYANDDLKDQSDIGAYEIIGNLVNSEGMIRIGDYLMCLDFDNHLVYTTESGTKDDLVQAKSGAPIPTVRSFDMQKDVLDEVLIPAEDGEAVVFGLFCKDRWAKSKASGIVPETLPLNFISDLGQVKLTGKVSYVPYGIYFDLRGMCRTIPAGGNISTAIANMKLRFEYHATRRCGQSFSNTIDKNINKTQYTESMIWGPRALTRYDLRMTVQSSQTFAPGASAIAYIEDY